VKRPRPEQCELCGRPVTLTFHHLIPRRTHSRRRVRQQFSRDERHHRGLWLCGLCHRQLHRFYPEDELAERLNTREDILADPQMQRFLAWARKQKV